MKTYTIKNTDIMHKGKIFPEGATIDLEEKEAESLSDFLVTLREVEVSSKVNKEVNTKNIKRSK